MSDNEIQEIGEGQVDKYIQQLEKCIAKRSSLYGFEDLTVLKYNHTLCKLLNQQGLMALQKQNYDQCIDYLRKAELATIYVPELKVQTFNNLACYYRKIGKTRTALNYLQQALSIELQSSQTKQSSLPDIYLNLCAVLSQLERHEEATQHIYLSIIMLQHELLLQLMRSNDKCESVGQGLQSRQSSVQYVQSVKSQSSENQRMSVLVVAYHNLGVEMEHLKKIMESRKIFQSALQLSEQCLPNDHQLRLTLERITKKTPHDEGPLTLKPMLPKVNQKLQDLKEIYRSVSPKSHARKQLKIVSKSITMKKNSFSETSRPRVTSINTTEVLVKNQENKDTCNLPLGNQTTIF